MSVLRWGLLSTARINRRLIPSIRLSKRSLLNAVASRDLAHGKSYAAEWNIPLVFGSYEEMLASDQVDAVYISLPNDLHAEWTIKALQAGKNVLCEKPFAITLAEVDRMIATANSTGKVLAEAFMYRHHPQSLLVLDLIREGKLGDVLGVKSAFHFRLEDPKNIRLHPEQGGGSLWDVGVYPISYSQMIMSGPPDWVSGQQHIGQSGIDKSFFGQMHYKSGQVAQFTCSFDSPFHAGVEIMGSHGRLTVTRPFSVLEESQITLYKEDGSSESIPVPQKDLYLGEIEDMESAVFDGKNPRVTHLQSRDHIRTALALYQSARENCMVPLE
jgi:D-xylose 1-dehydrogenase (NADP+, D-xylono-1,5-lactone-forming)